MMKTNPQRLLIAAMLLAAITATLGCGGGGGGGGGTAGSTAPCLSYMPDSAPAPSTVVTRSGSGSSCGTLQLEFVATGVIDLFEAGFRLTYDPTIMEYDSASVAGSHLSSDGVALQVIDATGPGMVEIDVVRLGAATGIDFNGEMLIRLSFDRVQNTGSASAPVTLSNDLLQDSNAPPVEILGIDWFGGTVELR